MCNTTSNTTFTPYHCNLIFLHFFVLNATETQYGKRYIYVVFCLLTIVLSDHMICILICSQPMKQLILLVWKSKFIQDIKVQGSWLQFVRNSLALCEFLVSFFRVKSNIICALTSTIILIRIIHSQTKAMHS